MAALDDLDELRRTLGVVRDRADRAPVAAVFVPSDVEGDALRRGEDGP